MARIDRHRECGRTIGRHGHAVREGNPVIARAQDSSIVNARHGAPERARGKLRLRDAERLVAASGVGQCDGQRGRVADGYLAETRRNGI